MGVWIHSRKGRIEGEVVREDDTWMTVKLTGDHELHYYSQAYRGDVDVDGSTITLRKSLMRPVDVTPNA